MSSGPPPAMAGLPRPLAERLWAAATTTSARSGKALVSLGAHSDSVYVVLKGRVRVTLYSMAGREVILRSLGEGALFGELAAIDGQPRSATIVALSSCTLAVIDAAAFRAAIGSDPESALWLARRLAAQVRDLTERVFELNALRVSSRLHCELLRLCADAAGGGEKTCVTIDPAPTHADLAARIGTHREAVTREMGDLAERGILSQERRRITVPDTRKLARLVEMVVGGSVVGEED
ncbi:MAG TPA: Crp/Fnr family transcriptional regulator [Allosphingosinicella sp.]|jgi:CRP-like cAMP-binding protein